MGSYQMADAIARQWYAGHNIASILCLLAKSGLDEICMPEMKGRTNIPEVLNALKPETLVSILAITTLRQNIQNSLVTLKTLLRCCSENGVLETGHKIRSKT